MSSPQIFSIGHSTHDLAGLLVLLRAHHLEQVADVRAHPGSRRLPWFNREVLSRELPRHGVHYVHLPQLGGRRRPSPDTPNGGWKVEGFRGYADHMAGAEFATGLEALQALGRRRVTAMMCAEGLWWRCHRRLISDALTIDGWEVLHVGPDGSTTPHELTQFAVLDAGRLTYPPAEASLGSV
ncbi:MAG: DUF488 domain-containing protein [Chloroflexota bacterium]|nr:DUF488 domain-containing protein [Chloroflexota bacterium]